MHTDSRQNDQPKNIIKNLLALSMTIYFLYLFLLDISVQVLLLSCCNNFIGMSFPSATAAKRLYLHNYKDNTGVSLSHVFMFCEFVVKILV